jgi:hypothetical protein
MVRTVLTIAALAAAALAVTWFLTHSLAHTIGWSMFAVFFGFFFCMLRKSQSFPFRTRGSMTRGSNRKAM